MTNTRLMGYLMAGNAAVGALAGYLHDGWNGVIAGVLWQWLLTWIGIGIGYAMVFFWGKRK